MCRSEDPAQAKQINEQILKKKKTTLTPSSSMTSLPLHLPWTVSHTWQLSLPQKNKTLPRSLSVYINWLSSWTSLFSSPLFLTSCTDVWSRFIHHFFLEPLDWRDWVRCSTHAPPHPLAAATPPSHQLDNKLLNLPFTVDPHPLASCLKHRRSQCTIVKWVNQ